MKMAKINHLNYLDIVDTIFSGSKEKGLTHINSDESNFDGKGFLINGKELKNFGTCGYLGLETHPKLAEGSIDMVRKYGTQFSMGRVFMRPKYIRELEELMGAIFNNNKVLCYTSTSTAHISVLATLIKPNDLIVLDQQVHFSVQFPAKNTKLQGTQIKMIRHSNFDMLEDILKEDSNKFERVWYLADGVYSMHGDFPDTDRLQQLLDKYPKLHLYFDDAHGMSWYGKNGAGYVFDRLGVSKRVVVVSTLAKGFGCVGGTAVFYDEELYRKVDIFGGPHSYSHPLTPASAGAAIASAKIHLSSEIYEYQKELFELTSYMDKLLKDNNLTNLSAPNSPIYYIGGGLNKVTHNFVNRVLNEGFYVNTATFPAVPNDLSGLRFTVTRHVTKEDIKEFVDVMAYHFPLAIEEEGDNIERVYNEFNLPYYGISKELIKEKSNFIIEKYNSINEIDKELWDSYFDDKGNINYEGLRCMEEIFSNNLKPEENWTFHYLIIKEITGKPILATFFTGAIYKDDLLSPENVSKKIEEVRKSNPYYLCSKTLAMGAMFGEGEFLYLDKDFITNEKIFELFLSEVTKIKNEIDAKTVIFRDFQRDSVLNSKFENNGYVRINMPNTLKIKDKIWNTEDELLKITTSKNSRDNIKRYALKFEHLFEVSIKNTLTDEETTKFYELFSNIKNVNFSFNFFSYPEKIVKVISTHKNWEFIELKNKENSEIIGCVWSYIGDNSYTPLIAGIDYNYSKTHFVYQQIMYQSIKRANKLNKSVINLGFSAEFEKKKYGAVAHQVFAFVKFDDVYNLEEIETYSNN
jgi:7-keto-8-aminopelargonate synthetase-like enzyme